MMMMASTEQAPKCSGTETCSRENDAQRRGGVMARSIVLAALAAVAFSLSTIERRRRSAAPDLSSAHTRPSLQSLEAALLLDTSSSTEGGARRPSRELLLSGGAAWLAGGDGFGDGSSAGRKEWQASLRITRERVVRSMQVQAMVAESIHVLDALQQQAPPGPTLKMPRRWPGLDDGTHEYWRLLDASADDRRRFPRHFYLLHRNSRLRMLVHSVTLLCNPTSVKPFLLHEPWSSTGGRRPAAAYSASLSGRAEGQQQAVMTGRRRWKTLLEHLVRLLGRAGDIGAILGFRKDRPASILSGTTSRVDVHVVAGGGAGVDVAGDQDEREHAQFEDKRSSRTRKHTYEGDEPVLGWALVNGTVPCTARAVASQILLQRASFYAARAVEAQDPATLRGLVEVVVALLSRGTTIANNCKGPPTTQSNSSSWHCILGHVRRLRLDRMVARCFEDHRTAAASSTMLCPRQHTGASRPHDTGAVAQQEGGHFLLELVLPDLSFLSRIQFQRHLIQRQLLGAGSYPEAMLLSDWQAFRPSLEYYGDTSPSRTASATASTGTTVPRSSVAAHSSYAVKGIAATFKAALQLCREQEVQRNDHAASSTAIAMDGKFDDQLFLANRICASAAEERELSSSTSLDIARCRDWGQGGTIFHALAKLDWGVPAVRAEIQQLLRLASNPQIVLQARDRVGRTPIHIAAASGNGGFIETCLQAFITNKNNNNNNNNNNNKEKDARNRPLPIEAADRLGRTPIAYAVATKRFELAQELAQRGASLSSLFDPSSSLWHSQVVEFCEFLKSTAAADRRRQRTIDGRQPTTLLCPPSTRQSELAAPDALNSPAPTASGCDLVRIDADRITASGASLDAVAFHDAFVATQIPVVIAGNVTRNWSAWGHWGLVPASEGDTPMFVSDSHVLDVEVQPSMIPYAASYGEGGGGSSLAAAGTTSTRSSMTLGDFIKSSFEGAADDTEHIDAEAHRSSGCRNANSQKSACASFSSFSSPPLYVFEPLLGSTLDATTTRSSSRLLADILGPPSGRERGLPWPFKSIWQASAEQRALLRTKVQLGVGPAGSGSPVHHHVAAMNALLRGRKRWFMALPGRSTYSTAPISTRLDLYGSKADFPLTCVQQPGDVLYVPEGYAHAVYNMERSVSIAIEEPVA